MAKFPTFNGSKFSWKTGKGLTNLADLGLTSFPTKGFYVRSPKTGRVHLFLPNSQSMVANEFYDGEAYDFFVPGGNVEIQIRASR